MKMTLLVIMTLLVLPIFGQNTKDLYMPREFKQAYNNETRSHEGIPGKNYFQNRADYVIRAEFFPNTKSIIGSEIITYKNNSSDSLSYIYINLYQNRFKKGEARDANVDPKNIHNGVEIKSIKINGTQIESSLLTYYSTILVFRVSNKILPNSENEIEIEWKQKMPETGMFRIGTYDESNFFVGYWYPKMNVYDDVVGWNKFGHTGNAEFYYDYGDFDVEITVPSEYNVWSSGLLQNTKDIFRDKYFKRINEASLTDEVIQIIRKEDRSENKITKTGVKHTWKFKSEHLPDFAFAVSNKYLWDATSVKIGDKRVLVNAVYNTKSKNFHTVAEISRNTIEYFSNTAPAIPYPYPQLTAFNGEKNGTEFPGIINDQDESSTMGTMFLTTHEIAHTYFPFYVGTNEQEYSWMDEGLATMIGLSAMAELMGTNEAAILKKFAGKYSSESAKLAIDIPPMTGSHSAGDFTYGFMTYVRPITAFSLLFDYLGKEKFYQGIQEFAKQWKGKHPIPYDLFHAFNKVADEDLGWFWKPWFFELGYADIAIEEIEYGDDKTIIHIDNLGSFPIPVHLTVNYKDGNQKKVNLKMDIWQAGIKSYKIEIPKGKIKELILNTDTPESFYDNNKRTF
jgi:Peptidase family M1 domain